MRHWNKNLKSENGAIMVEASIYFPIVLAIVFAIIYVSLWKLEDCAAYFAAQKVASSAANALAHEDYELLYGNTGDDVVGIDTSIDFQWAQGDTVPEAYVNNYYSTRKSLYKRVKINSGEYEKSLKKLMNATKFVPFHLKDEDVHVKVQAGLLRTVVSVEVTAGFQTPGIMRYIGFEEEFKMKSAGYQFVSEPVEFVRNADLAFDLIDYLFDRLGISAKIENFTKKWDTIKNKLGITSD